MAAVLGDYVALQRGTTYNSRLLGLPGPVLLGLASIRPNGGFRSDSLQTYGGESPGKLILRPGDIYVSLKDVTQSADVLGAVSRVPESITEGRLTQDTVKLIFKNNEVSSSFIFWLLRTPQYRDYCRARAIGTTNLSLSRDDFLSFPVPQPTPARLALVRVLEALEATIELNQRTDVKLEAMARAIFESWFVDFLPVRAKMAARTQTGDPVRAKAEGRQPYGTNAETALSACDAQAGALFPDSFQDSPLGKIPKGWAVQSLDAVAHFLNGLALQKYPPHGDEFLPVIKIAQLRKGSTEDADKAAADIPSEYVVQDGDVLFSWSGSLEVVIWCGGRGALNQHLFKVTSREYPKWFYYFWIQEHLPAFQAIASGKATTMGHIQRHHLTEASVLVPPAELVSAMDKVFSPMVEAIVANNLQSRTLTDIRNALLPKLISGEIRVNDLDCAWSHERASEGRSDEAH